MSRSDFFFHYTLLHLSYGFEARTMDFDPLSFFEPAEEQEGHYSNVLVKNNTFPKSSESVQEESDFEEELEDIPLQPLDLPLPNSKPPFKIMKIVLSLLLPEETTNFAQEDVTSAKTTIPKELSRNDIESLGEYLGVSPSSVLTIRRIPQIHVLDFTNYLTRVVSSPYPHYSEDELDFILNLASKVMTSHSSPALKGDTVRKITFKDSDMIITLKEPGITGDKIGNVTWGAAGELSQRIMHDHLQHLLSQWLSPEELIVELGSGTGLVTILLIELGYKVISTDLPNIINNLKGNVELNGLKYGISVPHGYSIDNDLPLVKGQMVDNLLITPLDWTEPNYFIENDDIRPYTTNGKFTQLIFADPVYSLDHPEWVQRAVKCILASKESNPKVIFMLGMRDRFQDVRDDLWRRMRDLSLKETHDEVIHGYDDYGKLSYQFKIFTF